MTDCARVYTHYYKLAHVAAVNYAMYTAKNHVLDQHLLELELQIRNKHPHILLAYYNKCLYHFSFSHWDSCELLEEYPIEMQAQASVSAEMLANPNRTHKKADKSPLPEDLAYASLSLLKAVKRSLLYNLLAQKKMLLFGNYAVAFVAEHQYAIVQVDPVLLSTGDLMVALTQRNSLALFPSSVLSADNISASLGSFVVYVVPSGLRCHFYDPHNLAQNFSKSPPRAAQNLLRLLKLSTGVDRCEKDITWVKLIPNLQHLNNQTSKILQFVHDVENKKFIVWPWELCILQFGSTEVSQEKRGIPETTDPMDLINDFISFAIGIHDRESQSVQALAESASMEESHASVHQSSGPVSDMSGPLSARSGEDKTEANEDAKTASLPVEDDPDQELFGASSDLAMDETRDEDIALEHVPKSADTPEKPHALGQKGWAEPYLGIPRDQMILQKSYTPDLYIDPGAPPPIMPTPILMQSKPSSQPHAHNSRDLESQGYAFSPIVFNPKIQSSIDAKYGRGGKFFVEREDSSGPESESKKPRMRETSVYDMQFSDIPAGLVRDIKREKGGKPDTEEKRDPDSETGSLESLGANDGDFDADVDMAMESDDESDEDEEDHFLDLKMSPLKLNMHSGDILNQVSGIVAEHRTLSVPSVVYPNLGATSYSESPSLGQIRSDWRGDSPMSSGSHLVDHGSFISSPNIEAEAEAPKSQEILGEDGPNDAEVDKSQDASLTTEEETVPNVSESSNCLPLILRSINVFSIPNQFLLRDGIEPTSSDFNMYFDDDDDDIKQNDGLTVKRADIEQFLKWLTLSTVFDMGTNRSRQLRLKTPQNFSDEVVYNATDGVLSKATVEGFLSAYPLSYRVSLDELMEDPEKAREKELSFLDELASETRPPESPATWDALRPETPQNKQNCTLYKEEREAKSPAVDENIFALNEVRSKIAKSGNIVNFNFEGLRFWRYLHFSPVNGTKKFQVLMIGENDNTVDYGSLYDGGNLGFLETLRCNFKENNLGSVKKLHLQSIRAELESVSDGLLLVEKNSDMRDYYSRVNRKLRNLAELIKVDLITKSNRFEFDRPLLLLFLNFDESLKAIAQISKICRNFHQFLKDRQLALVQVFHHVLPADFVSKRVGNKCTRRYVNELKLSKLALTLYNKCPDVHDKNAKTERRTLYTQLVKNTPTSVNFKFLNKGNTFSNGASFQDEHFLHVAYERSVDKNWISAAWSDPLGIVTHVRSWSCSEPRDVGAVIVDIWDISNDLFQRLKDALLQRTCESDKKRFLVLTRISSIIPDDELIFWKRLAAKYKDVSLIVLSTSRLPKYLFASGPARSDSDEACGRGGGGGGDGGGFSSSAYAQVFNDNTVSLVPSPVNALTFNSPNQFLNSAGNFLSPDGATPVDMSESDVTVVDPRYCITGVIPKMPLPSFNSPTRLGMRMGYLIKSKDTEEGDTKYMVFEVTLLSCSAYWSLNLVMKLLLNQYKNLIVMNEILGVCDMESDDHEHELRRLVPWHINAVVKTLDYLVHVRVEERE